MPPAIDQEIAINAFTAFYPFWVFMVFILGLFFGSFFNVAIYRIPAGLSVNKPKRSFCFRCGSAVPWQHNIPIISYFLLGGRCSQCGSSYSMRYAAVELLTGLLFLSVFLAANPPGAETFQYATIWYLIFAGMLLVATFTDIDHWIIPDGITIGGTGLALAAAAIIPLVDQWPLLALFGPFPVLREYWESDILTIFMVLMQGPQRLGIGPEEVLWWEPLVNAILGGATGFGLLYGIGAAGKVFLGRDAMGFGDVKLFALIGATLGVMGAFATFFLACFLGAAAGGIPIIASWFGFAPMAAGGGILKEGLTLKPKSAPSAEESEIEVPTEEVVTISPVDDYLARFHHDEAPARRQVHHLPFGPWIALSALLVLLFQEFIRSAVAGWIF